MARITQGPRNPNTKLDWNMVREIRMLYRQNWSQGRLAREFGVSLNTIGRIVRGESWQEESMVTGRGLSDEEIKAKADAFVKQALVEGLFEEQKAGKIPMPNGHETSLADPPAIRDAKPPLTLDEIMRREAQKDEGSRGLARLEEEARKLDGGLGDFIKDE